MARTPDRVAPRVRKNLEEDVATRILSGAAELLPTKIQNSLIQKIEARVSAVDYGNKVFDGISGRLYLRNLRNIFSVTQVLDSGQIQTVDRIVGNAQANIDKLNDGSVRSGVLLNAEEITRRAFFGQPETGFFSNESQALARKLFEFGGGQWDKIDELVKEGNPTGTMLAEGISQSVSVLFNRSLPPEITPVAEELAGNVLTGVEHGMDSMTSEKAVTNNLLKDVFERASGLFFKRSTGEDLPSDKVETALKLLETMKARVPAMGDVEAKDDMVAIAFKTGLDKYFNGVAPENRTDIQKQKARALLEEIEVGFDMLGENKAKDEIITFGFNTSLDVTLYSSPGVPINTDQQKISLDLVDRMWSRLNTFGANAKRDNLVDAAVKKSLGAYFSGSENGLLAEGQQIQASRFLDSVLDTFQDRQTVEGVPQLPNDHADSVLEYIYNQSVESFFTNSRKGTPNAFKTRLTEKILDTMTDRLEMVGKSGERVDRLVTSGLEKAIDAYFTDTTSETLTEQQVAIAQRLIYRLGRKLNKIPDDRDLTGTEVFLKDMYKKVLEIYFKPPPLATIPEKTSQRENAEQTRFYNPLKRKEFQDLLAELEELKGVGSRRFLETEDVFVEYFGGYGREIREYSNEIRQLYEDLNRVINLKVDEYIRRRKATGDMVNWGVVMRNEIMRETLETSAAKARRSGKRVSPHIPVDTYMFDQIKKRILDTREDLHFLGVFDTSSSMRVFSLKSIRNAGFDTSALPGIHFDESSGLAEVNDEETIKLLRSKGVLNRAEALKKSGIILAEVLNKIGIKFSLILFDTPQRVDVFKNAKDDYDPYHPIIDSWNYFATDLGGSTASGTAIEKARQLIAEVGANNNVVIKGTDGLPPLPGQLLE
jgi:hypothetical protein